MYIYRNWNFYSGRNVVSYVKQAACKMHYTTLCLFRRMSHKHGLAFA